MMRKYGLKDQEPWQYISSIDGRCFWGSTYKSYMIDQSDVLHNFRAPYHDIIAVNRCNDGYYCYNAYNLSVYNHIDTLLFQYKSNSTISYICFDATKNQYLVGTDHGLVILNRNLKQVKHIKGLLDCTIGFVDYDEKYSGYWVSAGSKGILYIDKYDHVTHINQISKYVGSTIHYMVKDKYDNLWLPTNNGLYQMTHDDLYKATIDSNFQISMKYYGIPFFGIYNEFDHYYGQHIKTDSNYYYFPTFKGLLKIDLEFLRKQSVYYHPEIEIISTGSDYNQVNNQLLFDHGFKSLTFSATCFYQGPTVLPQLLKYRLLNSKDPTWHFVEPNQSINLLGLEPGKYMLEVAVNAGKNSPYSQLQIIVSPKFYQTIFAIVLLFIIIIGLSIAITIFTLRLIQKRTERKREVLQLQTAALKSQLDSHFLFNLFQSVSQKIKIGSYTEASESITSVAYYLRNLLHINEQFEHELEEELTFTQKYLDYMLEVYPNKFTYEFDGDIDELSIAMVPTMILQPFLENTIKHGFIIAEKYPYHLNVYIELDGN
ncbi:MAG: histidine kinase [Bacteroidetes bacterium]|nr:histidine kinase [Bacteroidota bacterium]